MRSEKEKMLSGDLYYTGDEELVNNAVAVGNPCKVKRKI